MNKSIKTLVALFSSTLFLANQQELLAADLLVSIKDIMLTPDGEVFSGRLTITPNGYLSSTRPPLFTVPLESGVLQLALPSSEGSTFYKADFDSKAGHQSWTEKWTVKATSMPVKLADIRALGEWGIGKSERSSGLQAGSGNSRSTIAVPIPITDVISLSADLSAINNEIAALNTQVAALSSTSQSESPIFVNGEVPSGAINGNNPSFSLANQPAPLASLKLFKNGLRQFAGLDYTLSGKTISFTSLSIPQSGDILLADYTH